MNQEIATPRTPLHQFSVPLSAPRRGARLAARLIVAELAANAAVHGRVPGRSFRLALVVNEPGTLRIEQDGVGGGGSRTLS
ncbi:hypothetical protein [Streptomyces sp. NPDC127105]|uniref:hypothetical protein n=1 Tax=Streptomyces sp. NPDC127105 TaxID=3345359 RepID=UPI00364755C2